MNDFSLELPVRTNKPRETGQSILIDNGYPLQFFKDVIAGASDYIDFVKFGWGTSLLTKDLEEKISTLKEHDITFFFGGTLFEKYVSQKKVNEFHRYCTYFGCEYIEISNGTLPMTNKEKAAFIADFSDEFLVLSEVGSKDAELASRQSSEEWLEYIVEDMEAGAEKVITEA